MCGTSLTYPGYGHCTGCRCFQSNDNWLWTTTSTPTVKFDTPYQPKHRKPGPAQ